MSKNKSFNKKKKKKEDANDVLNQVHDLFKEAEVEFPDAFLDRTHRISEENNYAIVRFTTFRHRALFYRNRIKLRNQSIHLDLTKSPVSLLNEARKLTEDNEGIVFCYADINCRCKLRFKNKDYFFRIIRSFNHQKQIVWLFKRFRLVNLCCQWSLF